MTLSSYHQQQAELPPGKLLDKVKAKDAELAAILQAVPFHPLSPARVAVMGCADKRYIAYHQRLFEDHLKSEVEMTTYDITTEHLNGAPGVIQHDCTQPLPNPPYDVTYAHVLLKFIPKEQQWAVIQNSYDALRPGGIAIHVIDRQEMDEQVVPWQEWKKKLEEKQMLFSEVPVQYGLAIVLKK